MRKVIAQIKGGLGNQLFCYAAARRLALKNDAELALDTVTGFARDFEYRRKYSLGRFEFSARPATAAERMEPFGRLRRRAARWLSRRSPFDRRTYLEQEKLDFDPRVLDFRVRNSVYIDGLWQGEGYFGDAAATIRRDLRIRPPMDAPNQEAAAAARSVESVAVHVRWFDAPSARGVHNTPRHYYQRALDIFEQSLPSPRYFVFSDSPEKARTVAGFPAGRTIFVSHNRGDENAYADLWLMTQCRHFIIANSTFSWWGAWLAEFPEKRIVAPDLKLTGKTAWGFDGLIPSGWRLL